MSVQWLAWAFDELPPEVKNSDRLVFLSLANHASEEGVCWPGRKTVAREAGISSRTLDRCLVSLARAGWIRRKVNGAPQEMMRRKGVNNAPNLFQLTKTPHEFESTRAFRNVEDPSGTAKLAGAKSGTANLAGANMAGRTVSSKNRQRKRKNRQILNRELRKRSGD